MLTLHIKLATVTFPSLLLGPDYNGSHNYHVTMYEDIKAVPPSS